MFCYILRFSKVILNKTATASGIVLGKVPFNKVFSYINNKGYLA